MKTIHMLAGVQETRTTNITLRISMELVGLFANWKSGTTDTLEVDCRWRVAHRDTGEWIEFRNAAERKLHSEALVENVGMWLRGEVDDTRVPEVVFETLHEACGGAMQHEVFENMLVAGVRVHDPHEG